MYPLNKKNIKLPIHKVLNECRFIEQTLSYWINIKSLNKYLMK